jgi:hypothetical protein
VTRLKSFCSSLVLCLVAALALTCSAIGQVQVPQGGSNPNAFTCGGTTCLTPDSGWNPLDNNAATQTTAAMLVRALNGAKLYFGSNSADITLSTGGTTTDSAVALIPAGAVILHVVGVVSTTISGGTCSGWQLGDPTTAGRFTANDTTLTAGETQIGMVHLSTGIASATTGMIQPVATGAAKVRVTCATGAPGAGKVRVTVFYLQPTPPLP